jgi:hypothetical protein
MRDFALVYRRWGRSEVRKQAPGQEPPTEVANLRHELDVCSDAGRTRLAVAQRASDVMREDPGATGEEIISDLRLQVDGGSSR